MCVPASVPANFTQVVLGLTREGLRLLALAHTYQPAMSWHKAERLTREQAEQGLTMVGILILENRLKPESAPIIQSLNKAAIRSCMVTGDHVLTAVTVSRNCGIIPPGRPVLVAELAASSSGPSSADAQLRVSPSAAGGAAAAAEGAISKSGNEAGGAGTSKAGGERGAALLSALEEGCEDADEGKGRGRAQLEGLEAAGGVGNGVGREAGGVGQDVRFRLLEPERGWGEYLSAHTLAEEGRGHADYISLRDLVELAAERRDGEGEEEGRDSRTESLLGADTEARHRGQALPGAGRRSAAAGDAGDGGVRGAKKTWCGDRFDFEVAVTGPAFGCMLALQRRGGREESALKVVTRLARIFARMTPEQKQALVCLSVCLYVCEREGERERERERECVCLCVCLCVSVCVDGAEAGAGEESSESQCIMYKESEWL